MKLVANDFRYVLGMAAHPLVPQVWPPLPKPERDRQRAIRVTDPALTQVLGQRVVKQPRVTHAGLDASRRARVTCRASLFHREIWKRATGVKARQARLMPRTSGYAVRTPHGDRLSAPTDSWSPLRYVSR